MFQALREPDTEIFWACGEMAAGYNPVVTLVDKDEARAQIIERDDCYIFMVKSKEHPGCYVPSFELPKEIVEIFIALKLKQEVKKASRDERLENINIRKVGRNM